MPEALSPVMDGISESLPFPYGEVANETASDFTVNVTNMTDYERDAWERWSSLVQDRAVLVTLLLLFSLATVFGNTLVGI